MASQRCSICGQRFDPTAAPAFPFCSERCRLIDLQRWLGEEYALPHVPSDDDLDDDDFGGDDFNNSAGSAADD